MMHNLPQKTSTLKSPAATAITCACSHFKCSTHSFEQQVVIERFGEELDRALSHRSNSHSRISMSRDEDDRNIAFLFFQPGLQLQTRHLRHTDVNYQACSPSMQV